MKKNILTIIGFLILSSCGYLYAEDNTAQTTPVVPAEAAVIEAKADESVAVAAPTDMAMPAQVKPAAAPVKTEPMAAEPVQSSEPEKVASPEKLETENLEFVSGEISALDETNKKITIKLYGETEDTKTDKSLTVIIDGSTDITDGEKDRDLKSLTSGTEVDVEYDPSTSKATYIFVY